MVQDAMVDPGIDVFHLQRLIEDLDEFSCITQEHGAVLPSQELQTLQLNLIHMKLDVEARYHEVLEATHEGRPEVIRIVPTGGRGRPKTVIDPYFLAWAYSRRTTTGIARFLGVSPRLVRNQLLAYGIASPGSRPRFMDVADNLGYEGFSEEPDSEPTHDPLLDPDSPLPTSLPEGVEEAFRARSYLSNMSDDELDLLLLRLRTHFRRAGVSTLDGLLRRLGYVVPRERIRQSLTRIDPLHRIFQRIQIHRRGYSVPGPNSLWHHDGQHALIRWKILIHGFIDGYSRLITGLHASNNNWAATVLALFLHAIAAYGRPSRLRGDFGGENVDVAAYMEHHNGSSRGSYIWGQSIHNTRIERLWFDVTAQVSSHWRDRFSDLEINYGMDINNGAHLWLLQFLFLSAINEDLRLFAEGWNEHRIQMQNQANRSPIDMFVFDMLVHGVRGQEVDLDEAEMEVFGVDWETFYDDRIMANHSENNPLVAQDQANEGDVYTSGGRRPPNSRLNFVIVDPPEEDKSAVNRAVDDYRRFWDASTSTEEVEAAIRNVWIDGLAMAKYLHPDVF
ncbi:hypothetical protein VKT23_019435 [Stygiomarasmius scandens]|uniref:Integrase catalytic domain-containing protein n=1 Tax=Marasmiellus scandens TaxID=2682957 RepID=A0ABR1IQQ7_9AGAR